MVVRVYQYGCSGLSIWFFGCINTVAEIKGVEGKVHGYKRCCPCV